MDADEDSAGPRRPGRVICRPGPRSNSSGLGGQVAGGERDPRHPFPLPAAPQLRAAGFADSGKLVLRRRKALAGDSVGDLVCDAVTSLNPLDEARAGRPLRVTRP